MLSTSNNTPIVQSSLNESFDGVEMWNNNSQKLGEQQKPKIAIPAITLSIRSIPPIFVHIVLGVVPIMFTPQVNLTSIIDKFQLHLQ